MGCCKFIACGSSGTLRPETVVGHAIIVTSAVRDEGASYHYLPPSREVEADAKPIAALETVEAFTRASRMMGRNGLRKSGSPRRTQASPRTRSKSKIYKTKEFYETKRRNGTA
jgi:uridine phosphorylase